MRFLPLLLPLLFLPELFAHAARPDRLSPHPRLDRRDRLGGGTGPLLSMALTASGASECDGATPGGLTFTRASSATCTRADGTLAHLAANQPRVSARGLLVEGSATNLVLHSRDLTQAAWTRSNISCVRVAGADGVPASASNCVAVSTGSVTQALTAAAATRSTSIFLWDAVGCAGGITLSRDGGTTTTPVSPPAGAGMRYAPSCLAGDARCTAVPALSSGIANPSLRIGIPAGCSVSIDFVQDEAGAFATSPIVTAGTSATRAADVPSTPQPSGWSDAVGCMAMTAQRLDPTVTATEYLVGSGDVSSRYLYRAGTPGFATQRSGFTSSMPASAAAQQRARVVWDAGANSLQAHNDTTATSGPVVAFAGWAPGSTLHLGHNSSGLSPGWSYLSNLVVHNTTTGCNQ